MPLKFVLDEHLRGPLWTLIQRHNLIGINPIDVLRVGDVADLPLATPDADLIVWAARENRIIVTADRKTMPGHLQNHLLLGAPSPGIFVLRPGTPYTALLSFLVIAAYASQADEWVNGATFVP